MIEAKKRYHQLFRDGRNECDQKGGCDSGLKIGQGIHFT